LITFGIEQATAQEFFRNADDYGASPGNGFIVRRKKPGNVQGKFFIGNTSSACRTAFV
jgi:hypothetical protein